MKCFLLFCFIFAIKPIGQHKPEYIREPCDFRDDGRCRNLGLRNLFAADHSLFITLVGSCPAFYLDKHGIPQTTRTNHILYLVSLKSCEFIHDECLEGTSGSSFGWAFPINLLNRLQSPPGGAFCLLFSPLTNLSGTLCTSDLQEAVIYCLRAFANAIFTS